LTRRFDRCNLEKPEADGSKATMRRTLVTLPFAVCLTVSVGCPSPEVTDGTDEASEATGIMVTDTGTDVDTETTDDTTDTTETTDTGNGECVVTACQGKVYQCGDCIDNEDDDTLIDSADPDCFGPCDNNEAGFKGEIPGQNQAPCTAMDCYFDGDSGSGNDSCHWSHSCDPSQPNPSDCSYDENTSIPGSGMNCAEAQQTQEEACLDYCGPLVPNGCDCFGCCNIISGDEIYTVYLGTQDADGNGTCGVDTVADPELCSPCVQVASCSNDCHPEECEICIGQTELPDDCTQAECPDGVQSCDPANNSSDCPAGNVCVTGCCYPTPE
jgi:hypothetical protein